MTGHYLARSLALLGVSALGGWLASFTSVPMPWMLGSLAASACVVCFVPKAFEAGYTFPKPVRHIFVALIGVMIGTQVTPELFGQLLALPFVLLGLIGFVILAQLGNFQIFTRLGGFDRPTAFFSGTPGGLMEAIAMSEAADADQRIVTVQQFLRIILVVTALPFGLSLWAGTPLGSAAGATGQPIAPVSPETVVLIFIAALAGLWIGTRLKLPAGHITGAMLLSATATLTGVLDLHLPPWLIATAQLVIGCGLGSQFSGVTARMLRRSVALSLCSVGFMLALGGAIAVALSQVTGIPFVHMLISFAPGGVTEMSLVALSLSLNPALVSLNHILRILLTVFFMAALAKRLGIPTS